LTNLSDDPEQDYFADGMTDALITNLSKLRTVKVISRTSVMQFKEVRGPLPEIANKLGVEGVVEGTVQRSGGMVRITVQLIHAASDTHLWAQSYERDFGDVLALQGEVARAVAHEMKATLAVEESAQLSSSQCVNPDAYEAYLKGQFYWHRLSAEHLDRALSYFQLATERDGNYVPAFAGIANAWFSLSDTGVVPPTEAFPKARAAVLKALDLDETLGEAHVTLANIKTFYDHD
jgi:adenylate cyclase